jgi:hypothetical protein
MDALDERERLHALQLLAARYLKEKTQVCGWCMTTYQTPEGASACARLCRMKADAQPGLHEE